MSVPVELLARFRDRLLPQPRSLQLTAGELVWTGQPFALQLQGCWTAGAHQRLSAVLRRFETAEGRELSLQVFCGGLTAEPEAVGNPGDESYQLSVTPEGIRLSAPNELGVQRGTQTLAQLLALLPQLKLRALPCLHIEDAPAFAWRGLLVDVARHFIGVDALLRTLDGMAHHKMNVLHLHLTDDQAFRFPSTAYPLLNAAGPAYRLDELQRLVEHADSLGIRVVPELDMPGHTTSWLAAYPQWSLFEVSATTRFGVHPGCLNPAAEGTYEVIAQLLGEFAAVFPDVCVHIGGDEVHSQWWSKHPQVQAFMQAQGFAEPRDLQAYFNTRVAELLAARGKRMLVWDEAVHDALPKSVLVQAWRGMTARDAAVERGYDCIVSSPYYLDLFYPADLHTRFSPTQPLELAIAAEDALLEDVRLKHVADGLDWTRQWRNRADEPATFGPGTDRGRVFGAEACLWSELVDSELLDVRLWSRLPLLAELFWLGEPPAHADYTRIEHSLRSWELCGGPELCAALCGSLSSDQQDLLAPLGVTPALVELLAVLEPGKWYSRLLGAPALSARLQGSEMPQARPYDTRTSLRGVADVISPQSFRTAQFALLIGRWQQAPLDQADSVLLEGWLESWAGQSAAVAQLPASSQLRSTLMVLAQRLVAFARVMQRLFETSRHQTLGGANLTKIDGAKLEEWFAPVGELMLAPVGVLLALHRASKS